MTMSRDIIGKSVQIGAGDIFASAQRSNPFEEKIFAKIIAVDSKGVALAVALDLKKGPFTHAVVIPRYEGASAENFIEGKMVLCAVTLVPQERFSPDHPFDLTWWRGGGAIVADVTLVDIGTTEKQEKKR